MDTTHKVKEAQMHELVELANGVDATVPLTQEIKEEKAPEIEKQRSKSLFKKVDIEAQIKKHVELKDRDITEMLKTQKEYQQFGKCTCCGHKALSFLSRLKSLIFTIIFLAGGLVGSFFLKETNKELADQIFFYTIYLSFLLFCIPLTGFINYFVMLFLLSATQDTWKVFYIKGIQKRLHLSILAILWFMGFWSFGNYAYEYDYNKNIFSAILCVLISSIFFLATHLFIRYTALNSYFDIFKIEARKLKTYVTMIEMMANIPKKRKEYKLKQKNHNSHYKKKNNVALNKTHTRLDIPDDTKEHKEHKEQEEHELHGKPETLFSIPVMNFLIDFPSTAEKNQAKKERKKKVSFRLIDEDKESVKQISAHIMEHDEKNSAHKSPRDDDIDFNVQNENENENKNSDNKEVEEEEEEKMDAIDKWLKENELSPVMKTPLNQLNIKTLNDLEELLSDLYNNQFGYQSGQINTSKMNAINKIQRNVLRNNNVPYSAWKDFAVAAQDFIKSPMDDNETSGAQKKKTNTDIDEVEEILGLDYKLYSINLSSNIHTVKIINDDDLDRLTRVVSHLIFARLKEFKEGVASGDIRADDLGKQITEAFTIKKLPKRLLDDLESDDPDQIYWKTVKGMFRYQEGNNKGLLEELAYYAWLKFAPQRQKNKEAQSKPVKEEKCNNYKQRYDALDVDLLNVDIFKIFKDLLLLKQSIDSYTIIIINLQRMVDVVTPFLLFFVYLYIFDFNFEDALGFYISIVGIIGFFGSEYFSSVFASISFIMALNPYLVGDIICYDAEFYQVQEISLISCSFKHLQTGQLCTFQNKHLGDSDVPIINLSRTEGTSKFKYQWILYFKHSITNRQLTIFKKRCKELISKNKITKGEAFWTIKVRSNKMDDFQRKQINVSMQFVTYSNDVNSICFNYCTQAMTELSYHWQPLSNMNNAQWFPLPPDDK